MSVKHITEDQATELFGYKGIRFGVLVDVETETFIRSQKITFAKETATFKIAVTLRFDDELENGHESFSITGDTWIKRNDQWHGDSGGCIHEEITKHFPNLKHLIKWHNVSTIGPMHYVTNVTYLASNRDYNGLLPGERKQINNGRTGLPSWQLVAIDNHGNEVKFYDLLKNIDSETQPHSDYKLEYRPWCDIGKGKPRDFEAARSAAVWPEATEEQLSLEKEELTKLLMDRLPGLLAEFRKDMDSCGFIWHGEFDRVET